MREKTTYSLIAAVTLALLVSGCGGSSGSDNTSIGRISLAVSDGPVHDATKVCVEFNEVEFRSSGQTIVVDIVPPETINLLDFQGANAAPLLISQELPAGDYQSMRLGVNAVRGGTGGTGDMGDDCVQENGSYIVVSGAAYNLYVPSGENNGLRLVSGFTVPINATANFTAEFDLMKSVTAPDGLSPDVLLRPTIRLVNNIEVGTLTGAVSSELALAVDCEPSIFVFDDGVTPNEIDDMDDDPVATAIVGPGEMDHEYEVGYLLAGNYNVSFTCDGMDFVPSEGMPASVSAGGITVVNFF